MCDGLAVTMTTYYITEFGSSRVFMTCTMDWTYGYHDYIFRFEISRVFAVCTMDWINCVYDGLDVAMTTYLSLEVVEYLLCV